MVKTKWGQKTLNAAKQRADTAVESPSTESKVKKTEDKPTNYSLRKSKKVEVDLDEILDVDSEPLEFHPQPIQSKPIEQPSPNPNRKKSLLRFTGAGKREIVAETIEDVYDIQEELGRLNFFSSFNYTKFQFFY